MRMREWWSNIVVCEGADGLLYGERNPVRFDTRADARVALSGNRNSNRFRVHVKLKPEGAPKRYSDALDRWMWEQHSDIRRAYPLR